MKQKFINENKTFSSLKVAIALLFLTLSFMPFKQLSAATNWYYNGTGALNSTSSWGTSTDGTGGTLSDFTSGGRYFIIQNATAISLTGTWNIGTTSFASAGGDSLIIGNPSTPGAAITLTLTSGSALTVNKSGTISVSTPSSGNHKIIYQNSTAISFGTIYDPNLEIVFDGATITSVSTKSFGDLSLINNALVDMSGANAKFRNITVNAGSTLSGPTGASSNFLGIRAGGVVTINGTFKAGRTGGLATTSSVSVFPVTLTTNASSTTASNASAATGASTTGLTRTVTCTSTSSLAVGDIITVASGTGAFPTGTFVRSITSSTVFVASAAATTQLSAATISTNRYTLPVSSSTGVTVGGSVTKLSGTGTFAGSTVVTGIPNGTSVALSAAPTATITSGASVQISFAAATSWSTLVFEDFAPSLVLGSNSTIEFNRGNSSGQAAAQTIDTLSYANLTLSNAGFASNKTFLAGTYNISGNLTVSNFLGTISVPTGSTINLTGSSSQTIPSQFTSFSTLGISGGTKTMTGNISVTSSLNLISGVINTTSADTLTVTSAGTVSRTSGWVQGNLNRNINVATNTSRVFNVGDATNYAPITLTFANVTTQGNLTVSTATPLSGVANYATAPISNTAYVNRYWNVSNPSAFAYTGTYTAAMTYVNGDIVGGATSSSLIAAQNVGGTWSKPSTSGTANVSTASGLTSIGSLVLANDCITVTPSVSISGTTLFCTGTSNTYTATPTNGGSAPTYQWKKNGNNISGATNTTLVLTNTDVANNDVITCVMTANNICQTTATATSNTLTATLSTTVTPSVSISGTTLFCTRTSNTYTATPTNGGSAPTYQWKKNGNDISGATNATLVLTNSDVANGDAITCVMTANNLCQTTATANSNSLTVIVATTVTPSVSINSTTVTFCTGTTGTFTATPTNGGSSPTYQWKKNGNNILGATNTTLNLTTADVANGDVITCVLTANNLCQTSATASSNGLTLVVGGTVTPSVSISTASATVCSGNSVIFTTTGANVGSSPIYQWKINGNNLSTGSTITFSPNVLTTGDVISCMLTANNTCQTSATANSNTIGLTVIQSPVAASINSQYNSSTTAFSMCTLGGIVTLYPSIANGVWSSSNAGTASVARSNASSYSANVTAIANGTTNITYSLTTPNSTCVTATTIAVTVAQQTTPNAVTGVTSICAGANTTFTTTSTGGVFSTMGRLNINNATGFATAQSAGTTSVRYTITNASGCSAYSSLSVIVNAQPAVPGIGFQAGTTNIAGSGGYCKNKSFTLVGNPSGGVWSNTGTSALTINPSSGLVNTGATTGTASVTYSVTDANTCTNSRTINSNIVACKGIASQQSTVNSLLFNIYPNPARLVINLKVDKLIGVGNIIVTDLYGKQIKQQTLSMGVNNIDVSNFAKGMYLVSVITEQGKQTQKVIVE